MINSLRSLNTKDLDNENDNDNVINKNIFLKK